MAALSFGGASVVLQAWVDRPPVAEAATQTPSAPAVESQGGTLVVGSTRYVLIKASGWPKPQLTEVGALPAGVSFVPYNGFAVLRGDPAPGTADDYYLSITATNSQGSDTESYDLTVQQNPVFPSNFCPSPATVGQYFHDTELVDAYPPFFGLSENSDLPDGVSFNSDLSTNQNEDLGYLSGTPTAGSGGRYSLQYSADASSTNTDVNRNWHCILLVDEQPAFTDAGMATINAGTRLTSPVVIGGTTGFPRTVQVSTSGSLPPGMSMGNRAGPKAFSSRLNGDPTVGSVGDYLVDVTADNGAGDPVTEGFVLVVDATGSTIQPTALSLTPSTPTTTYGTPVTFTATVTGSGSPTGYVEFDVDGANAPVTVPLADGTASWTTPADLDAGADSVTATYTGDPLDASSSSSTQFTIDPLPTSMSVTGPTSTAYGAPVTLTATVTSPQGTPTPQGFVDFNLDGSDTFVPLDSNGQATFTTDPTLLADGGPSGGPWEVDATFSSYSDAPGDWADATAAPFDYTIGPVQLTVIVGDGNPGDPTTTVADGGSVSVVPDDPTQISVEVAPVIAGTGIPSDPMDVDVTDSSDQADYTSALGLSDLSGPSEDPVTGQSDYFWTIPAGALSGLGSPGDSIVFTLTYTGGDDFAPGSSSFTLTW